MRHARQARILGALILAWTAGCGEPGEASPAKGGEGTAATAKGPGGPGGPGAAGARQDALETVASGGQHLIDAPSLLVFLRAAPVCGIEHETVAGLQRGHGVGLRRRDDDRIAENPDDGAHAHSAMAR